MAICPGEYMWLFAFFRSYKAFLAWFEFLLMKETINGNSINNLGDLFRISCNTSHNLRSKKVLSLAKPSTNALKRSFSYKVL